MSEYLTFGELAKGSRFIMWPVDGDNSGHGGYRSPEYLWIKHDENYAVRTVDGGLVEFSRTTQVIQVMT
jgi:hypothetical protein